MTLRIPSRTSLLTAAILLSLAGSALGSQMYRYLDDDGRPVITSSLPQEVVSQGYEILNQRGRVVETVPPAPTEEEIAQREQEKQAEREREAAAEKQRELDRQLLRQFSSADDTVRALQRSLREMFSLIQLKQGSISNLEGQLAEQESTAANLERQGRDVPDSVHDTISRIQSQKEDLHREITGQLEDIEETRQQYRVRIERMEELTGQQRTLPLTIPEEDNVSLSDYREH